LPSQGPATDKVPENQWGLILELSRAIGGWRESDRWGSMFVNGRRLHATLRYFGSYIFGGGLMLA
jgi:hypothetical protein